MTRSLTMLHVEAREYGELAGLFSMGTRHRHALEESVLR
jgi:hypothetical protein